MSSKHILLNTYDGFEIKIRKLDFSSMVMFWQSYLDRVQSLLDFVKSIRLPDRNLHLQSTERMLVWIHAYDRTTYARNFGYYLCSQQKIQNKFPTIYQQCQHGNFSKRRTKGKFIMLSPDPGHKMDHK